MRRVGAREGVDHVQILVLEEVHDLVAEAAEVRLGDRLVDLAPEDPVVEEGSRRELVLRRAAGVAAGVDDERPARREDALAVADRVHVERRRRGVARDAPLRMKPVGRKIHVTRKFGDRYGSASSDRAGPVPA